MGRKSTGVLSAAVLGALSAATATGGVAQGSQTESDPDGAVDFVAQSGQSIAEAVSGRWLSDRAARSEIEATLKSIAAGSTEPDIRELHRYGFASSDEYEAFAGLLLNDLRAGRLVTSSDAGDLLLNGREVKDDDLYARIAVPDSKPAEAVPSGPGAAIVVRPAYDESTKLHNPDVNQTGGRPVRHPDGAR
jgi:hypothetical protein